jgi:hypothetical protein
MQQLNAFGTMEKLVESYIIKSLKNLYTVEKPIFLYHLQINIGKNKNNEANTKLLKVSQIKKNVR